MEKDLEGAARALNETNVIGVFNTIFPALERMRARGAGQIALMSSLASFGALTGSAACKYFWQLRPIRRQFFLGIEPRSSFTLVHVADGDLCSPYASNGLRDPFVASPASSRSCLPIRSPLHADCASKAAVRMVGDSLRAQLAREGIRVTTICPGVS